MLGGRATAYAGALSMGRVFAWGSLPSSHREKEVRHTHSDSRKWLSTLPGARHEVLYIPVGPWQATYANVVPRNSERTTSRGSATCDQHRNHSEPSKHADNAHPRTPDKKAESCGPGFCERTGEARSTEKRPAPRTQNVQLVVLPRKDHLVLSRKPAAPPPRTSASTELRVVVDASLWAVLRDPFGAPLPLLAPVARLGTAAFPSRAFLFSSFVVCSRDPPPARRPPPPSGFRA